MANAVQDSMKSVSLRDSDASQKLTDFVDQEIMHYFNTQVTVTYVWVVTHSAKQVMACTRARVVCVCVY